MRLRLRVLMDMHIGGCQVWSAVVTLHVPIGGVFEDKILLVLYLSSPQIFGRVPFFNLVTRYLRSSHWLPRP